MLLLSTAFAADMVWTAPNGASIRMPPPPSATPEVAAWALLYWPTNGGFASNVNIQQQRSPGGLDAWWALSQGQFAQMGFTTVKNTKFKVNGHDAIRIEYSGNMMGASLHWDAVGIYVGQDVWMATCTAPEAEWATWGPLCKKAIDSFTVP